MIREAFGVTLARAQAGNEAAFACIFRDVQPGLLRYSRVIAAEVEDVAGRLRELRGRRTVLFEVTFAAGLDKARYPELSEAGDAVLARGQTSHWTRPSPARCQLPAANRSPADRSRRPRSPAVA